MPGNRWPVVIADLRADDPASVGPYRLLGHLGAGGMGQVYLGRSPGGRLVAIKLIRPELAEERGFRARFASEINAAKNVSGVYTAAVVDADADARLPWMATVYVPGPSLADAVEENGPLPVTSVLTLAGGLAEALAAIHRAGLVHRDLKPSNVLLAADGPRVIDFGISLAAERSVMTTTGMVVGSPGFMSPEQARGERDIGAATDVFSLGAVLAYAATGNNPFGGGPTPALLYRVVNEAPDLAAVPGRLSLLVGQCLEKNPANRPTPAEILALLGDDVGVLGGEWLPPSVTQTMVRYTPTVVASATAAPAAPARPAATVAARGTLPGTAVGAARGAVTTAGRDFPGRAGGPPPGKPPSPFRRWRWPLLAAAVAVIIVVVAVLLVSRSPGGTPRVNTSRGGSATHSPATQAATTTPTAAATTPQPSTQAPSTTAAPTQSAPATQTPAPSQTATAAPTQSTPAPTTSASATSGPTQAPTSASSAPGTPVSNSTGPATGAASTASGTASP